MAHVLANGIQMAYQEDGAGPPLVMGHSLALDRHLYDEVVTLLSQKWRVIRPDFRGHGGSGCPHESYTIDDMTDDLLAFVDAIKLDRFCYAGLSMGGMIGMRFAMELGERIEALVLMDTSADVDPNRRAFEQWAELVKDKEPSLGDINSFLGLSLSSGFLASNAPCLDRLRAQLLANDPMGNYFAQIAVLRRPSVVDRLGEITAPTLIVVGEKDMPTPVSCAEQLHAALPGSKLMVVPESGHLTVSEAPAKVAGAIDEHCAMHWGRS
jgi:pimeloyl-ACP methyl ester carboxylesterase